MYLISYPLSLSHGLFYVLKSSQYVSDQGLFPWISLQSLGLPSLAPVLITNRH